MDNPLDNFTKIEGRKICDRALTSYEERYGAQDKKTRHFASFVSGFTAAQLAVAFHHNWLIPLKRQAGMAIAASIISLGFLVAGIAYLWSAVSFSSFSKFIAAFVPAIAALIFTCAKAYKSFAEAQKALAEAKILSKNQ